MANENKLNVKKTILLSFGFFASSVAWSIYNSYVPLILEGFLLSSGMIGIIMTFDNVAGMIIQPLFGNLSDKTRTRIGRRMPYIFLGIPISAAIFTLIPQIRQEKSSLWLLITVLVVFVIIMSTWRAPAVSLMPDITPGPLRSQANGIVNMVGGIGTLIAFLGGGLVLNAFGYSVTFIATAGVMVLALLILVFFVREPGVEYKVEPEETKAKVKVHLAKDELKSLLLILFGIFFWFAGYNAVETFFTLYATNELGMKHGSAAMLLSLFSLTFLVLAVPAGFLGAKIGRRKTILIGLTGLIILFIPLIFVSNVIVVGACLLGGGVFWACVNINSLPMVVRLAGEDKFGTFIGYYYFFSFAAQIASPILFGFIRDATGDYKTLFVYCCIAFALALTCLFFVRHGEDKPETTTATQILDNLGD